METSISIQSCSIISHTCSLQSPIAPFCCKKATILHEATGVSAITLAPQTTVEVFKIMLLPPANPVWTKAHPKL